MMGMGWDGDVLGDGALSKLLTVKGNIGRSGLGLERPVRGAGIPRAARRW